jgi:hypothetical protein
MAFLENSKNVRTIKSTLTVLLVITLVIYIMSIIIAYNHYSEAMQTIEDHMGANNYTMTMGEEILSKFIQREVRKHHVSRVNASAIEIMLTLVAIFGVKKDNFTICLISGVSVLISNILLADSLVIKRSVTFSFTIGITALMSVYTFILFMREEKAAKIVVEMDTSNQSKPDEIVMQ